MPEASVGAPALIEWGVASLAMPGEAESGDRHLVKSVGTGVLVAVVRSEEHTSELQSRFDLVCRLLLEKKKFFFYSLLLYFARQAMPMAGPDEPPVHVNTQLIRPVFLHATVYFLFSLPLAMLRTYFQAL